MRKGLFLIISIISALLLTSLLNFGHNVQTAKAEPYFFDDFNDGVADGWTQRLGSWQVTNGEYRVSVGIVENGISTVNGLNLTDCVIETQLRFTDSVGYEGGIVFRYLDNSHYYAFQIGHEYDHMEIITYDAANPDYGNYAKRAVIQPLLGNNSIPINLNVNYTLRIEIQGTNFNAYFNGQHVLSWTDNSYSSGLVGLRARRADVNFDNFKIENATVQPSPSPTPMPESFNDEFASGTLSNRWVVIDPAGGSTFDLSSTPGYLTISTSTPPDRDLWEGVNFNSPRIMQAIYGNFTIETKLLGLFNANIQSAGIVVWKDENNYLRLERDYRNDYQEIIFNGMINGVYSTTAPETVNPGALVRISNINPTYLRISRDGNRYSGYYSSDGENWTFLANITLNTDYSMSAGLYNVLRWAPSFSVSFDYFRISSPTPTPIPTLAVTCRSSTSYSGFNVEIKGSLTFNGTGLSGAPILLSYSVTGGKSWEDLTLVYTSSDGSYSAVWMPSVTGNYLLKAAWEGNDSYSGVSVKVSFSVTPFAEQSVFSVTSNSTISELSFNSISRELSFGVSGDSGTTGYVKVYIPKSLINDISSLKVYLDGNQIVYSAESQSDCWLLYFTYQHSTHMVTINLGSPGQPNENPLGNWIIYGAIAAIVVIIIIAVFALRRMKTKKQRS